MLTYCGNYLAIYVCMCSPAQLCPTLCDPLDLACQTPLPMGFLRQEYWGGLPFPLPRVLPNPGIKPMFPASPALQES